MKKLLALLGISVLTTTSVSTIVGCQHSQPAEEDPNIRTAKDAEILNKISQRASNAFFRLYSR